MNKREFLEFIQPSFKSALKPSAVYPCEIGEYDHHLWIRGSQVETRKNMKRRNPGYWDISVVPFVKSPFIVLRVWTYDGGTGINQKLANSGFADLVVSKRKGLKWRFAKQIGDDKLSGHGLYDFYRESEGLSSSCDVQQMIEGCIEIEKCLVDILKN